METAIIFLVIALVVSVSQGEKCPGANDDVDWVYNKDTNRCFTFVSTRKNWHAAQRHCAGLGFAGSLAYLDNDEVSEFARTSIPQEEKDKMTNDYGDWLWIDTTDVDKEGEWRSIDGREPEVKPFGAHQPDNAGGNEHFIHVDPVTGKWNDVPAANEYMSLCQVEAVPEGSIQCPNGWHQNGDVCYKYIESRLNWYDAQERCSLLGNEGKLAFVGSEEDNNKVFEVAPTHDFWIGISDICHEAKWSDYYGKTAPYLNFAPGEPNDLNGEDCLHVYQDGRWNDLDCSAHQRPFVCQISATYVHSKCPSGWVQRGENCYRYFKTPATWDEAQEHCQQEGPGGELPFVGSEDENNEVYEAAAFSAGGECVDNFQTFWIGMTDGVNEGTWTDKGGVHILGAYTNWAPGEPNNAGTLGEAHVEMYKGSKLWNDRSGSRDAFVCRLPLHVKPDCNSIVMSSCPDMWTFHAGACYLFNGKVASWAGAKSNCNDLDANLVSNILSDSDEISFLGNYISMMLGGGKGKLKKTAVWIDLNDQEEEGTFVWGDGSQHEGAVQQAKKKKKKDCVLTRGGYLYHEKCANKRLSVCKKPAIMF